MEMRLLQTAERCAAHPRKVQNGAPITPAVATSG